MIRLFITTALILSLQACVVFPLDADDPQRALYWCPPLHNCASTEATTFVHSIAPFELDLPLEQAWPIIRKEVAELPNTSIEYEYDGYIYAKSRSDIFRFVDYLEILAVPSENRLNVRSSSLLGLSDLFVNYFRTEKLRERLEQQSVIKPK